MRSLVIDFDLAVLLPLILLASGVLWNSVRRCLDSRSDCKAALIRIEKPFDTREEGEEFLEWGSKRCAEWHDAKRFIWFPSIALVLLCALMLTPGVFKVEIAEGLWYLLCLVSVVSFVICIPMAWHYAKELDWLKFGICLLAMLMLAASAEHFMHQKINARHVNCPHCGDDDDDQPDDN
ncbi:MAG: hypothetical protein P4K93_02650 [Terracidiphilus sp.]|nr:hypothetical protein [Terracidiphilus sp.]